MRILRCKQECFQYLRLTAKGVLPYRFEQPAEIRNRREDSRLNKGCELLGRVTSVNISDRKGVRKREVQSITLQVGHGIVGDAHAGDWHRQISLLAEESIDTMRALGLSNLTPGAFAENINTEGIVLNTLPVGTVLRVGACRLRVTQIGKECHNDGCAIQKATGRCVMPTEGIFAVVLTGGTVQKGDAIEVEAATEP